MRRARCDWRVSEQVRRAARRAPTPGVAQASAPAAIRSESSGGGCCCGADARDPSPLSRETAPDADCARQTRIGEPRRLLCAAGILPEGAALREKTTPERPREPRLLRREPRAFTPSPPLTQSRLPPPTASVTRGERSGVQVLHEGSSRFCVDALETVTGRSGRVSRWDRQESARRAT